MELILLPLVTLNLCLYLFWTVFKINFFSCLLAVLSTGVILFVYWKKVPSDLVNTFSKNSRGFSFFGGLLILFNLLLVAAVLSPYVNITKVDGFESVGMSSVTDMFKHSYVISAIRTLGLPPHHPYFPPANLSYYYGYYLVPSLLSWLMPWWQNYILFCYILLTDLFSLLIFFYIVSKTIRSSLLKLLSLALVIFGMGWDIIPMFLDKAISKPNLIEMWSISHHLGLRIDNTFVSLLWTPQHFFAASLSLLVLYLLVKNKGNTWLLFLIFAYVSLSSVFVAIGLAFSLGVLFLLYPKLRKQIFLGVIFSVLLLIPYLLGNIGRSSSIFNFYKLVPFSFVNNNVKLNYFLTIFVEYGLLFFVVPFFVFFRWKKYFKLIILIYTIIFAPVFLTWFVQSNGYNDLALRITILPQLMIIIFYVKFIEKLKNKPVRYFLIFLIFVNLCVSTVGFVFEYTSRWKARQLTDPYESELIIKLRTVDQKILFAASGIDGWVFKIPPLAFRPIYNTDLYDSGAYLQDDPNNTFGKYETTEKDIFYRANSGIDLKSIVLEKNLQFQRLHNFFSDYKYDWIIFDNRIGVKSGQNPWTFLLENIGVLKWKLTNTFVAYNRLSLVDKLRDSFLTVDYSSMNTFKIIDNKVSIPKGVWYLAACNNKTGTQSLRFNPEDAYMLFDSVENQGWCTGNMFYLEKDRVIKLAGNTINQIFLFPITYEKSFD